MFVVAGQCLAASLVQPAGASAPVPDASVASEWVGQYQGVFDANGRMTIEASPAGTFRIVWSGGEDDAAGAATAADCMAVAKASLKDKTHLRADLVPFKDDNSGSELTAEDLKSLDVSPLDLAWSDKGLVRVSGTFPQCGLNVAMAGLYWRPADAASVVRLLSKEYDTCSHSGADMTACSRQESQRQDDRLNRDYKALLAKLSPAHRNVIRQAQRQWLTRRDRLCARSAGAAEALCIAGSTAARADDLEKLMRAGHVPVPGAAR